WASLCTLQGACQSQRAMPPYCRGSKHQKNGLAPLEERKRLCDPPNLPNLISFICLFPINMQPLALFLRKEPGGLSSISSTLRGAFFHGFEGLRGFGSENVPLPLTYQSFPE